MYVTRPLSRLLKSPESLAAPPEGPNSGYLVIQDEESEAYNCFGFCKNRTLKDLPFPQNKKLAVRYVTNSWDGLNVSVSEDPLFLIPVLNQPLSSNRYYAVVPHGKYKGKAITSSREEDKASCCFCRCTKDANPKPLDPHNIYQQFQIVQHKGLLSTKGDFVANSVASDGFPPYFIRRGGWAMHATTPRTFKLGTARGVDSTLRARLPDFSFSVSRKNSEPCVVGKWYTPFVFVKKGREKDQVKRSMYYEVTLEQRWEQVFSCGNDGKRSSVAVDVSVEREEAFIGEGRAKWDEKSAADGVVWFRVGGSRRDQRSIGMRVELVERMKWEQGRGGWKGGEERVVKVKKVKEMKKGGKWSEFGWYVLVERFNLKRMDGSLVMFWDFKHLHHMKTKWE